MRRALNVVPRSLAAVVVVMLLSAPAQAGPIVISATLTADNFYSLYFGSSTSVTYVGRNDVNDPVDPYDPLHPWSWCLPESFTFEADTQDYIYVAAWSDDQVAQGLIGEFNIGGQTIVTRPEEWEVAFTGISKGIGSPAPTESELAAQLAIAQWLPVGYSLPHGSAPWGTIPGISADAYWMWGTPMTTEFSQTASSEYMIYRRPVGVPEPSTLLLTALGAAIGGLRYRRRSR